MNIRDLPPVARGLVAVATGACIAALCVLNAFTWMATVLIAAVFVLLMWVWLRH
ncbi:MAG: hypothetical protein ABW220_08680 [Burkholderiaceae bacterium]